MRRKLAYLKTTKGRYIMYCDILIIMFFPSRNPYLENRKNQHQQKQKPLVLKNFSTNNKTNKKEF